MAHSFAAFNDLLDDAEEFYTVDLSALNSSGVQASAVLAVDTDGSMTGTPTLNVLINASGTTANQTHVQHIHGLFDGEGAPIDSVSPTIADDADRDGMVEVLEGVGKYGDVLLPLARDGMMPMANADGDFTFSASYSLDDDSQFMSPVTMTSYTAEDIMPLTLREIVIHGVEIPDDIGEGTMGEVDGGENGYIPILPAAAGEIAMATRAEAQAVVDAQLAAASRTTTLTEGDDSFDAGAGSDRVLALGGNDTVTGGTENDTIDGGADIDVLDGDGGDDVLTAGGANENAVNASDDGASGALSLADYDGGIAGGAGGDRVIGGAGDEILTGDDDSRISDANGTSVDLMADGQDTIFGGAGNDEIHTGTWTDSDQGLENAQFGSADDIAFGGAGDDILRGAGGNDRLVGDSGADNIGGGGGNDIIFGDGVYNQNVEGLTGQLFRLYNASFDRDPDMDGFHRWISELGTSASDLGDVAAGFVGSQEFTNTYGSDSVSSTNEAFVDALYANVLDREADAAGREDWLNRLESGTSRAEVLVGFSESAEFRASSDTDLNAYVDGIGTHDVIAGNGGDNQLSGGYFSDTFVFSTDEGSSHTVKDLESWDMLDFSAFELEDTDAVIARSSQVGDDVVFSQDGVTVTLEDTQLNALQDDMIIV